MEDDILLGIEISSSEKDRKLYEEHRPIGIMVSKGPKAGSPRFLCPEHKAGHIRAVNNLFRAIGEPAPYKEE